MTSDGSGGPLQYSSSDAVSRFERAANASLPGREAAIRMAASLLAAQIPANGSVLSVGTGTGLELSVLCSARPDWTITGVDPSAPMVELARARLEGEGSAERVTLMHGTVDQLPANTSFDGAICIMVLGILPNDRARHALLESVAVRLKPGSPFVFTLAYADPMGERFDSPWKAYQRGMGQNADEIDALFRQVRAPDFYMPSESMVADLLTGSGFTPPKRFFQAYFFGGWMSMR